MALSWSQLTGSKHFKYGIPFILLIVGGSFGLKQFSQLRYQFRKNEGLDRNELEALGIELKPAEESTIEAQYEKIKQIDIDNWEPIRGPRPWEKETVIQAAPPAAKKTNLAG